MADGETKILVLVEGEKTDVVLMEKLFNIYDDIASSHQIVSYNTSIYVLYNKMFYDNVNKKYLNPEDFDLLQILKERERDPEKKKLFDEHYSDILLIFDLDPQDPQYSADKIRRMSEYFVESSDMGKLYLNYPMVEAFYHMKSIPDDEYNLRYATIEELNAKKYKERVNIENRNRDYTKFAVDKAECNIVIRQNVDKAFWLCDSRNNATQLVPDSGSILAVQLNSLENDNKLAVLCTCVFYIVEYNPRLIESTN